MKGEIKKPMKRGRIGARKQPKTLSQEQIDFVKDFLSVISLKNYDAEADYKLAKLEDLGGYGRGVEKMAERVVYMRWTIADKKTRSPKTVEELGKIIKVKPETMRNIWRYNKSIRDNTTKMIEERIYEGDGYAMFAKCLAAAVGQMNTKAMQLYLEEHRRYKEENKGTGNNKERGEEEEKLMVLLEKPEVKGRHANRRANEFAENIKPPIAVEA